MMSQEKSVKQFITEMREAGLDFEYKAVSNDGKVFKSKGWIDDNKAYKEAIPLVQIKKAADEKKKR
jgi:hypothetical protein